MRRSGGYAAAALAIVLGGGILTAPSAAASADRSLSFSNESGFLVDTCYEWKGPDGIQQKNYCHGPRPVADKWKAHFPAEATGATVKVSFAGYTGGPPKTVTVDDVSKDHCFKLKGTWPDYAEVLKVNC
ncbi:hypothetical protein ADL21_07870 [Streptomyces albus subsp. albus]|nr:hypothetical protein ADL21_07870 [Streptomyces albus subsp. albus]